MDKLLQLLSPYNFLNNLMPGAVFFYALTSFCGLNITFQNYLDYLFVYYFLGLIISRIGSVVIEPLMEKLKLIKKAKYVSFIQICKEDKKLDVLSEINNVYRTFLAGCILISCVKLYAYISTQWKVMTNIAIPLSLILLIVLFGFSYRKQTGLITRRVETQLGEENDTKQSDKFTT